MITSTCTQDGRPPTDQLSGKPSAEVEKYEEPHPMLLFVKLSVTAAVVVLLQSSITIGMTTRLGGASVQETGSDD